MLKFLETVVTPSIRRPRTPLKVALLLTLWTLGNNDSFREISDRFGVSQGCSYKIVIEVCKILTKNYKLFIKWPSNEEMQDITKKFNILRGSSSFPNVVGCVDGMHITIPAPTVEPISYFNRKGYHSMILQVNEQIILYPIQIWIYLQGVCDSDLRFTDVFFGWPGRSHDAYVWSSSTLGKRLQSADMKLPNQCHLLGDTAYPLRHFLMVPFKDDGRMDEKKKKFNKKLSSTRVVIEQAFGLLCCKFRRLKYLNVRKLQHAKYMVVASIALHNFALDDPIPPNLATEDLDCQMPGDTDEFPQTSKTSPGKRKRKYLADVLN